MKAPSLPALFSIRYFAIHPLKIVQKYLCKKRLNLQKQQTMEFEWDEIKNITNKQNTS